MGNKKKPRPSKPRGLNAEQQAAGGYDESPELRDLLTRAAKSSTVRRKRQPRDEAPDQRL